VVEKMVEIDAGRVKALWREGKLVVVKAQGGSIDVVDGGEMEKHEDALPALVFECGARDRLLLQLPPPRFSDSIDKAGDAVEKLVNDLLRGLGDCGCVDGLTVLNSFAELCTKLYRPYTTRGLWTRVNDTGGDYPTIEVEAVWRG
jgi:hypothetical protein